MTTWKIVIICVIVAAVVIVLLTALAFRAGFKNDMKHADIKYIWHDRKRNWLGLPWSFTKYFLSEDRLFIQKGFFKTTYDEVRLYRVLDVQMAQGLGQKIASIGSITVHSSDKTLGCFTIANIKAPMKVKELLSEKVEEQRDKHRVYSRESMADTTDENDHDFDFDLGHEHDMN